MENIALNCVNSNTCLHVCNVKTCKAIPFLCADEQCQCYKQHLKCISTLRWKRIRQSFSNKLKKSLQLDKYFTQIHDLYKSVMKQIEKSSTQIKNISEIIGLSELEQEVYQMLKQKKFAEFTGELISKLQGELMKNKKQYQIRFIEKQKKKIYKQTQILVQMLQELTKLNMKEEGKRINTSINESEISTKLDNKIEQNAILLFSHDGTLEIVGSKIIKDISTISSFFLNKKIVTMKLLYRASENKFQTDKFWQKCDGKKNTITIIKTQFNKVIGGYTSLPWDQNKNDFQRDSNMQSFIFSLTNKHKLQLVKGRQQYAILYDKGRKYGPVFGGGCDLAIHDRAHSIRQSYAKPGYSYKYKNEYHYNSQQSYKKFSGQSYGEQFKIQEWQVYEIVFR